MFFDEESLSYTLENLGKSQVFFVFLVDNDYDWISICIYSYDIFLQLHRDQYNEEANRLFNVIDPLKHKISYAVGYIEAKHYDDALVYLKEIIEVIFNFLLFYLKFD